MIEFRNVSMVYSNGTKALKNVDIKIEKGEFVFVVGTSGAGKSTFLKLMMREEVPSQGQIFVNNYNLNNLKKSEIPYFRRTLGIVFQDFRLIPSMQVYDNVAFAMRVIGAKEKEISKRVAYTLSLVGLSSKARMLPSQLSGGEQQRVAMARALVNDASIIIADEPTGNVDPEMSREIIDLLDHINANGTTVIMVTHEHDLVRQYDKRVITIKGGTVVSDSKISASVTEAVEEASERSTIPNYYDAPNENVDVEEFLRSYGADEKESYIESTKLNKKEQKTSKAAEAEEKDSGLDIRSIDALKNAKNIDYSVYFEPSDEENDKGGSAK